MDREFVGLPVGHLPDLIDDRVELVAKSGGFHGISVGRLAGSLSGVKQLVVGALIVDDRQRPARVLAARRATPPAGRWEFPGGKVEVGETAQDALVREIGEELLVVVEVLARLDPPFDGRWPISDRLEMELWWCTADGVPVAHDSHDELRWLTADELGDVDWLDGDLAALPAVAERLRG